MNSAVTNDILVYIETSTAGLLPVEKVRVYQELAQALGTPTVTPEPSTTPVAKTPHVRTSQKDILSVLHDHGPCTIWDIRQHLVSNPSYQQVRNQLHSLRDKGLVYMALGHSGKRGGQCWASNVSRALY